MKVDRQSTSLPLSTCPNLASIGLSVPQVCLQSQKLVPDHLAMLTPSTARFEQFADKIQADYCPFFAPPEVAPEVDLKLPERLALPRWHLLQRLSLQQWR